MRRLPSLAALLLIGGTTAIAAPFSASPDVHASTSPAVDTPWSMVDDASPAIAPDRSFIVFSSDRPPSTDTSSAIFIAFATPTGWSTPEPLGPSGTESRLSPDRATLYFSGADKRIHRFALSAWLTQHATQR